MNRDEGLLLLADAEQGAADLEGRLRGADLAPHVVLLKDDERRIARHFSNDRRPSAVALAPGLPRPLAVARQVRELDRYVHIVFALSAEELDRLRREMSLAPRIGSFWTIADVSKDDIAEIVRQAARSTRQRRQLRTTLDRLNLKLSAPAVDGGGYRKLVVSDKFFASVLNYAGDAIFSVDPRGEILTWNRGAERLFGCGEVQAVGSRVSNLVAASAHRELATWLRCAHAGQPVLQRELVCVRQDGSAFDAELTLAPIEDEEGSVIALSVTARDVSARKRAEEALKQAHDELEERVRRRTADLEAMNEELEAFAYSVSHDLRTPLRGIDGFSQVLLKEYGKDLNDEARNYLNRIRAASARMGGLIEDLLALSRLSRVDVHSEPVDLSATAKSILESLKSQEPDRNVTDVIQPGVRATGDAVLLGLLMQNLLENAWKYTSNVSRARIEFGASEMGGSRTYWVSDNGAGFDMRYADKLFRPFQRLHASDEFSGSGIGLATAERIVRRHNGTIRAESSPGKGAAFYFTLGPGA